MTISQTAPVSPRALWTGRVLSAVIVLFMIFDGVIKLPPLDIVTQTMVPLGWPADPNVARMLGIIGLVSTALYALPRTSVLGAILLTGYRHQYACRQPAVLAHAVRGLSRHYPVGRPVPARPQDARADPVHPIGVAVAAKALTSAVVRSTDRIPHLRVIAQGVWRRFPGREERT